MLAAPPCKSLRTNISVQAFPCEHLLAGASLQAPLCKHLCASTSVQTHPCKHLRATIFVQTPRRMQFLANPSCRRRGVNMSSQTPCKQFSTKVSPCSRWSAIWCAGGQFKLIDLMRFGIPPTSIVRLCLDLSCTHQARACLVCSRRACRHAPCSLMHVWPDDASVREVSEQHIALGM